MSKGNILSNTLQKLGLSPLAIQVYETLVKLPDANIKQIADKIGVYRLKIYQALDELVEIGLIVRGEDYSRIIELSPPSKLMTIVRMRETEMNRTAEDLSKILPDLQSQYYSKGREPITKIYQGKKEFTQIFHQILEETKSGDEMLIFSEGQDFYDIIDIEYFKENWLKPRVKKNVFVKILLRSDNPEIHYMVTNDKADLRQTKILPDSFKSLGAVWVCGNKILNWNTAMARVIVITDSTMAKFYKDLFEIVWNRI